VALLSETHPKPHERFSIRNYHFYRNDRHAGIKGGTAIAVKNGVPHRYVDFPPLISIEATGVCIPIGSTEIFLAAVYRSPVSDWTDTDIIELLRRKEKIILAGNLNAKHPLWNSRISNKTGTSLLYLQYKSDFQISAPQYSTHYIPSGIGDVLGIVLHKNTRISEINVLEILDSDHLPILFYMLDHVSTKNILASVETFTDWDRFQT
jgi:hypothetical protein